LPEDFRRNAERCFKLAQDALTVGIQVHWIDMAQLWLDLARHAEECEVTADAVPSIIPDQMPPPSADRPRS